jgi:hypothetical protein
MENSLIEIFAVAALLGAALLQAILAIAGYRSRAEHRQREQNLRALQKELLLVNGENIALGRRLSLLERHLAQAPTPPEKQLPSGPIGQAYEVAVNLVRKGTDVAELIATCGLSHGEADLIMRLYGVPAAGVAKSASAKSESVRQKRPASPVHTAAAAYGAA